MSRIVLGALVALAAPMCRPAHGSAQVAERALLAPVRIDQVPPTSSTTTPAVLSLVLPGAGQHVLGQRRQWLYGALEAAGWLFFFERRAAGGRARDTYRDYAWDHGRIQAGARVDGDFPYYETLTHWERSGDFDADAGTAGVQPEMDPATFNGAMWELASDIYLPGGGPVPPTDPAYQAALAYYGERAYGTDLLWDWSTTPRGQETLADLIEDSDDRFRQATTVLGLVIANHLLSAADAFVSGRGRDLPASVRLHPEPGPSGPAWSAVLSVPIGH